MSSAEATKVEHWGLPAGVTSLLQADPATYESLLPVLTKPPSLKAEPQAKVESAPFIDALNTVPDALTANGAGAFSTTKSALVDLFADLLPGVNGRKVFKLLDKAWAEDKEATLRIIFHARSIHEGKGAKLVFFRCVAWLWEYHPRTLLANLDLIVKPTCERKRSKKRDAARAPKTEALDDNGEIEVEEHEYPPRPHGSFDDLNDILVLAVNGQLTTSYTGGLTAVDGALAPSQVGQQFRWWRQEGVTKSAGFQNIWNYAPMEGPVRKRHPDEGWGSPDDDTPPPSYDENVSFARQLSKCGTKSMRDALISKRAVDALGDVKLQVLYLTIVDLYARYIRSDLDRLAKHNDYLRLPEEQRRLDGYAKNGTSPHLFGMSYAGKWAPTPGKSADKQLHLATALALKLFPNDSVKAARQRLQAEVLAPLRRVLSVPEVNMVRGPWKIEYSHVPALAMNRYQNQFAAHDPKGFDKYLASVASGKSTIAGASMMPHELVDAAISTDSVRRRVATMQWDSLVDSIRSSSENELSNCIAVADVSGSMGHFGDDGAHPPYGCRNGQPGPILPCIALTMLLTELARPPWNGAFIAFSEDPKVNHIDMSLPLPERLRALSTSEWGFTTNYAKVFDGILRVAKKNNLAPEDMVKKIFVFSDMQFDSSTEAPFGISEHQVVCQKFERAGYEVPEMVYWDLAASASKPVQADTPGVALVSGFSGSLLKYFIRSISSGEEDAGEDDDEWEEVKPATSSKDTKPDEEGHKEKKQKVKPTPLEHLKATINIEPFNGVRVVD